jgi:hypothetical protein
VFSMVVVLFKVQRPPGARNSRCARSSACKREDLPQRVPNLIFFLALAFHPFACATSIWMWPRLVYRATEETRECCLWLLAPPGTLLCVEHLSSLFVVQSRPTSLALRVGCLAGHI